MIIIDNDNFDIHACHLPFFCFCLFFFLPLLLPTVALSSMMEANIWQLILGVTVMRKSARPAKERAARSVFSTSMHLYSI